MKLVVSVLVLQNLATEAKGMPGMRIGQHVYNSLFSGTALEAAPALFYCADADFWTVVQDFVTIT